MDKDSGWRDVIVNLVLEVIFVIEMFVSLRELWQNILTLIFFNLQGLEQRKRPNVKLPLPQNEHIASLKQLKSTRQE